MCLQRLRAVLSEEDASAEPWSWKKGLHDEWSILLKKFRRQNYHSFGDPGEEQEYSLSALIDDFQGQF